MSKKFLQTLSMLTLISLSFFSFSAKAMEQDDENRLCGQPNVSFRLHSGNGQALIQDTSLKWDNGTCLFYHFLKNDGGDDNQKNAVRAAFQEWKNLGIGLYFQEESDPYKSQIKIGFERIKDGKKCLSWSRVGTDALLYARGATKTMNFAWDLTTPYGHGTALHEIGHALGFQHEHQNPDAGIEWDTEAVLQYYRGPPHEWDDKNIQTHILSKFPKEKVRGGKWDPYSIMHYYVPPKLIRSPERYWNEGISANLNLSYEDIRLVREFYPPIPCTISIPLTYGPKSWVFCPTCYEVSGRLHDYLKQTYGHTVWGPCFLIDNGKRLHAYAMHQRYTQSADGW